MSYDGAGSLYAVRMRVARLNAAGATPAGTASMIVSKALVRMEFAPSYDEPQAIERKNGAGELCVFWQPPPTLKQVDISALEVCSPDPELEELLAGGTILTASGATVGMAWPQVGADPTPNGVSVEVFTRAIINGAPAVTNPYIQWVFPRLKLRRGNVATEEGAMAPGYTGFGQENPTWGNGPANDWTFASDRCVQWARVATLPDVTDGVVAIPTQTP